MSICLHPCSADLEVTVVDDPAAVLPVDIERAVAQAWLDEKARRGEALFNGEVLSVSDIGLGRLICRRVEYRWFVAQRVRPDLFAVLAVRPLAVTGLLTCADGIVFGQRSAATMQDAGLWELAPAGGADRPDFRLQLLAELAEEIGMHPSDVAPPRPLFLVEDAESHVIDIVCRLDSELTAGEVEAIHRVAGSDEYSRLSIVPPQAIEDFLDTHPVSPVSRTIIGTVNERRA